MSQGVKSSLPSHLNRPSHLSPDNGGNEGDAQFERRHGKTRSHMVGEAQFYPGPPQAPPNTVLLDGGPPNGQKHPQPIGTIWSS